MQFYNYKKHVKYSEGDSLESILKAIYSQDTNLKICACTH